MFKQALAAVLAAAGLVAAAPAAAETYAPITVVVLNVHNARGHVRVDVCTNRTFLRDCAHSGAAPARVGATTVMVENVPPGVYAIQAYQDENDNHKVDQGFLGIPKEPVGFSNDAPIRMMPPRFDDAAFRHGAEPQTLTLRLRHFR